MPLRKPAQPGAGRWGQGLTREKMEECRWLLCAASGIVRHPTLWLRPLLVAEVEFVEWTPEDHLRHASFMALKDGVDLRQVHQRGT